MSLKMLKVIAGVVMSALLFVVAYYAYKFDQGDPVPSPVKVQLSSLNARIDAFALDHRRNPYVLDELLKPGVDDAGSYATLENLLDAWGEPIRYECVDPHCKQFTLASFGSDRKPGGDSHAADVAYDSATGGFIR